MANLLQLPDVTRIEVITDDGRVFTARVEPGVEVHVQDEARTVKVFAGATETKKV